MILVTGGTGFVGRHLVARLVGQGEQVRVLARGSADAGSAEVIPGDIRDLSALVSAARDCESVVHLVGIIREERGASFEQVHVAGARTVVHACQEAQVNRLLHMSALGARPGARSRYHRTKWEAEELVRASGLAATIFRPSIMFGAGNSFLPEVRALLHRGPVIPIMGDGTSLLQPIWVEDVVSCFVAALAKPDTVGRAYELGGPETFGFEELLDLLAEQQGITKRKLHLPVWLMRPAVSVLSRLLPNFPLTSDQLTMLLEDNVCDIREMRDTFGIVPVSLREHMAE
jgi:NADH dehydrogenase